MMKPRCRHSVRSPMLNIADMIPRILFLGPDPEKIMICALTPPQHYYHSQDIESTKTTIDRETKTTLPPFFPRNTIQP